ncbi:MAG: methylmalonyl-CoA epimerase, partial [Bacteroidetes bacterium]|nr:methylmalonyl-CoA epimerase [Bacteroidota bacterium]
VDNLHKEIERLKKEGFVVLNDPPKPGADGKLIAFLHPKTTGRVLVELCQDLPQP